MYTFLIYYNNGKKLVVSLYGSLVFVEVLVDL